MIALCVAGGCGMPTDGAGSARPTARPQHVWNRLRRRQHFKACHRLHSAVGLFAFHAKANTDDNIGKWFASNESPISTIAHHSCHGVVYLACGSSALIQPSSAAACLSAQAYDIPALHFDLHLCRTNRPPHTAVRGPGEIQATMLAEHLLEHVAARLGADPAAVRERNFLRVPGGREDLEFGFRAEGSGSVSWHCLTPGSSWPFLSGSDSWRAPAERGA